MSQRTQPRRVDALQVGDSVVMEDNEMVFHGLVTYVGLTNPGEVDPLDFEIAVLFELADGGIDEFKFEALADQRVEVLS